MSCNIHSWWFDTACPACPACPACEVERLAQEAAAAFTVAVMCDGEAWLDIPKFLQRNPDNTMRYPDVQMAGVVVPRGCAEPVREAPSTLADRQELYRAAYEADKHKRAQIRFAKLKADRKEKQTWELTRRKRLRT